MKKCSVCKQIKIFEEYYKSKSSPDNYGYRCKKCDLEARKIYRKNNRESFLASQRKRNYKFKYNISLQDYEQMLLKQNNCCAICKTNKSSGPWGSQRLAIDHCHKTRKIRGLLCNTCNRALGLFKDDLKIISSAIKYLEIH